MARAGMDDFTLSRLGIVEQGGVVKPARHRRKTLLRLIQ
jgi:hypothetical protein